MARTHRSVSVAFLAASLLASADASLEADPLWVFGGSAYAAGGSPQCPLNIEDGTGDIFNFSSTRLVRTSFACGGGSGDNGFAAWGTSRAWVTNTGVHASTAANVFKGMNLAAASSYALSQAVIYDTIKLNSATEPAGQFVPVLFKAILHFDETAPPQGCPASGLYSRNAVIFTISGSFGSMTLSFQTCAGFSGENTKIIDMPIGQPFSISMSLRTESVAVVADIGEQQSSAWVDAMNTGRLALIPLADFSVESASGRSYGDPDTVSYQFTGFLQPIDNQPSINRVKAGAAIPVKFTLGGNKGIDVIASGYPTSQQIGCDYEAPTSDVEQTVAAGDSTLSYDPLTTEYTYVWKTDKAWAGTCRTLVLQLADGQSFDASFRFTR